MSTWGKETDLVRILGMNVNPLIFFKPRIGSCEIDLE
jgi:hypothetical protein